MNLLYILAAPIGGIGMFGALLAFKRVLFGPPVATADLIVPVFLSGLLIGCAAMLVTIAGRHRP